MNDYKILNKGVFESTRNFEKRLNEICQKGWKALSIGAGDGSVYVLLEKAEKYI